MTVVKASADEIRGKLGSRHQAGSKPAWADPSRAEADARQGTLLLPLRLDDRVFISAQALSAAYTRAGNPAMAFLAGDTAAQWQTCNARRALLSNGSTVIALAPDDEVQIRYAVYMDTEKNGVVSTRRSFSQAWVRAADIQPFPKDAKQPLPGLPALDGTPAMLDPEPQPISELARVARPAKTYTVTVGQVTYTVKARSEQAARKIAEQRHRLRPGQPIRHDAVSRDTGARVQILDSDHPDSEITREADEGRWVTLCDTHGDYVHHDTLTDARDFAPIPQEWCESCQHVHDEVTFTERLDRFLAGDGPDPR